MRSRFLKVLTLVLLVTLAVGVGVLAAQQAPARGGQGGGGAQGGGGGAQGGGGGQQGRGGGGGGAPAGPGFTLTNTGWPDGGEIPAKHAGGTGGQSISPALSWSNVPMGTVEFVLFMHDPEPVRPAGSVNGDIVHWMVAKIPASATSIPEGAGAANATTLPAGSRTIQAYRGPGAPATGPVHHYTIIMYALNAALDLPATADPPAVLAAMEGKVAARALWAGRFMQPR